MLSDRERHVLAELEASLAAMDVRTGRGSATIRRALLGATIAVLTLGCAVLAAGAAVGLMAAAAAAV